MLLIDSSIQQTLFWLILILVFILPIFIQSRRIKKMHFGGASTSGSEISSTSLPPSPVSSPRGSIVENDEGSGSGNSIRSSIISTVSSAQTYVTNFNSGTKLIIILVIFYLLLGFGIYELLHYLLPGTSSSNQNQNQNL